GWDEAAQVIYTALAKQRDKKGAGLRVLTEEMSSPTLAAQLRRFLAVFPAAKWHACEPVGRDNVRSGARLAFGENANVTYNLKDADVVLALDADFLSCGPGHLYYAREFADRRRVRGEQKRMNRLYVVEST